ncbi:hypothetical protein V8E51_018493 [Hyaloscypha variabilis]
MSLPRPLLLLLSIAITSLAAQRTLPKPTYAPQNASISKPQLQLHTNPSPITLILNNNTIPPLPLSINNWQPPLIPQTHFTALKTLQPSRLFLATHPLFSAPVILKLRSLYEVDAYRILHGLGVTPEFLGYVTDGSQTIGFVTEFIDSEEVEEENGGRGKEGCLSALEKVHERGIAHGDAHDGNCMVRADGSAVLIDWELYVETWEPAEFERGLYDMGGS